MRKLFIRYYFKKGGWELIGEKPSYQKYIIIMLPHTSMRDFVLGWMFCHLLNMKVSFLIKKEVFFFPLNLLLKSLGGIPVDRSKNKHLAEQLITYYNDRDDFALIITPEGTRKRVKRLKRGFYHIAQRASVPVFMGFIDLKTKKLGVGPEFVMSGDYNKDIEQIKEFYQHMQGIHPDRFDAKSLK